MKRIFSTVFLLFSFSLVFSQEKELTIDQQHLHLDLQLVPDQGKVIGEVSLVFKVNSGVTDSVVLNAIRMDIQTLNWNSRDCAFRNTGKELHISIPAWSHATSLDTLTITYESFPRKGIYFRGWKNGQGIPQIWTQGQGIDHRHWIPHQDNQTDKLTHSIDIKFPTKYKVVSNGVLKESSAHGDSTLWKFETQEPAPSYLIALAAGEYGIDGAIEGLASDESGPVIHNYYYPELKQTRRFYRSKDLMYWMQDAIGIKYPWSGPYREIPVRNFKHGAMENTGCVIIGDIFLQDNQSPFIDRTFLEIEAHEMAHHWFGNYVTAEENSSHWFHEGFASYWQWEGKKELEEIWMYNRARGQAKQRVFETFDQMGPFSIEDEKAGSIGFYDKGGWVVSMLRDAMDSNQAKTLIKEYLEQHAFGLTGSHEFFEFLTQKGVEFSEEFYNYWVHGGEIPTIEVNGKKGKWKFSDASNSPVRIEVLGILRDGSIWKDRIWKRNEDVEFTSPKDVVILIPDPRDRLLVKWDYEPKVKAKYLRGLPDSVLARVAALVPEKGLEEILEVVVSASSENQPLFKQTVWSLFQRVKTNDALLLQLFDWMLTKEGYQRIMDAMLLEVNIPLKLSPLQAKMIGANRTYISMEAYARWLDRTGHPDLLAYCRELISSEAPSIQKHAVIGSYLLHKNNQLDGTDRLVDLAGAHQEFITRTMALNYMSNAAVPIWDLSVLDDCLSDFFDPNGKIAKPCRNYTKKYLEVNPATKEVKKLILKYSSNWTDRQREVFEKQTGWTL